MKNFAIIALLCLFGSEGILADPVGTSYVSTRSRETPLLIKSIGGLGERNRTTQSPAFRCEIFPTSVLKHYHLEVKEKTYDFTVETRRLLNQPEYEALKAKIKGAHALWKEDRDTGRLPEEPHEEPVARIVVQHTYKTFKDYSREISESFPLYQKFKTQVIERKDASAQDLVAEVNKVCVADDFFPGAKEFGF